MIATKPSKGLAAVLHEVANPLEIEEVAYLDLGPIGVLVRNVASGLCHSDLEIILGSLGAPVPIVLGHELAGIVEAVGRDVTSVEVGDHIVGSWMPNCGTCFYCVRDQPVLCERTSDTLGAGKLTDGRSHMRLNGMPLNHFSGISSHAQYSVISEGSAIRIPDDMPLEVACLLGCAVATGVCGAIRVAGVTVGSTVVVVGCGAVGLNVVQGARLAGAELIVAVDKSPGRLARAKLFGATHLVNSDESHAVEIVRGLTQHRGADIVIEAGGTERTMQLALEASRPGAAVVILGKVAADQLVSFRFGSLMGERRITRSSYGGVRPARDFPLLCRAYLDGRLLLDELVDRRIAFDEVNEAFAEMRRGELIRAVLDPWRGAS